MATTVLEPAPGLRGVTGEPWTGVRYFSTWRVGGVSLAPRDSLNLGTHVGDDPEAVRENRSRLRRALPDEPVWLEQVHGTDVFDADAAPASDAPVPRADAAVTTRRGRPLAIMTADCLPVVLADEAGTVLGVAHAGWRGLAAGVLENTLDAMRRRAPAARWRAGSGRASARGPSRSGPKCGKPSWIWMRGWRPASFSSRIAVFLPLDRPKAKSASSGDSKRPQAARRGGLDGWPTWRAWRAPGCCAPAWTGWRRAGNAPGRGRTGTFPIGAIPGRAGRRQWRA